MRNDNDLISIIIPVYNVKEYLSKCLESVCAQTYQNTEIVLIDDGSTDGCAQICDEAAKNDSRVRVIHQENGGRSVARNRGIEEAKGKYLLFTDGDDWIDADCVQKLYDACVATDATLAVGRYREIYKDCIIDHGTGETLVLSEDEPLEFYVEGYKGYQNANSVCVKLYSRDLLENIRFAEGKFYEDIMFVTQVYCACRKCVYLDVALYNYNIGTETSITFSGVNELTFRDEIPAFSEKERFLKEAGRQDLADRYAFFKFQRLLTYYRDCQRRKNQEDKGYQKRIRLVVCDQKDRVNELCHKGMGSTMEQLELKLFLIHGSLYLALYNALAMYGKMRSLKDK